MHATLFSVPSGEREPPVTLDTPTTQGIGVANVHLFYVSFNDYRRHCENGETMSLEENKALVRRYCTALSYDGDLAALDDLCGPEFTEGADDLARVKARMSRFSTGFPDARFVVEDLIAEGDTVWLRWSLHGTHLGELLGMAPTGKAIHLDDLFNIFRVANGKLVEATPHWGCQYVKLFEQIGATPPA